VKKIFSLICVCSLTQLLFAQTSYPTDPRSDSIDILKNTITLDIIDFAGKTISGNCVIDLKAKVNGVQTVNFDFIELTIDSVKSGAQNLTYTYDQLILSVSLPSVLNIDDQTSLNVYYHGQPEQDASWGGWYWSTGYSFQLGVGFTSDPHVYGRVWFPCFDNFTERQQFEFDITTPDTKMAFCNGALTNEVDNGNGTKTFSWLMDDEIPSYLACVAVGPYVSHEWNHAGMNGNYLIQIACTAGEESLVDQSFIHLNDCIDAFENAFGPYEWDKVGYAMVPFNSGAMEHATLIAYPRTTLSGGTLNYEDLMAHEFGHMWWGDLITCRTAEDMWLNEGWAVYCEKIFFEHVYGRAEYDQRVAENHRSVLQFTHITDGGYRAVSGVPHDYTYGSTVYNKGADVAHTLRGCLGDSLFFHCTTEFLQQNKFTDQNSETFRDFLSSCSGMNMTSFFDNWIFAEGFPHFSIDSMKYFQNVNLEYETTVWVRQRLDHAPDYYDDVPLDITYVGADDQLYTFKIMMSGKCMSFSHTLPVEPADAMIDAFELISDAVTANSVFDYTIDTIYNLIDAKAKVEITNDCIIGGATYLRIEHNWVNPDPFKIPHPGLHLADRRYWTVHAAGCAMNGTFEFNAQANAGFLDINLITNVEDSLVMLYRATPNDDWAIADSFSLNVMGPNNNEKGEITIYNMYPGEYTFAIYDYDRPDTVISDIPTDCIASSINEIKKFEIEFEIYPNPANQWAVISCQSAEKENPLIKVFDLTGNQLLETKWSEGEKKISLDVSSLSSGTYFIQLQFENSQSARKVIVIN